MGCGTGPFGQADTFEMVIRFNKKISAGDAVYTHFKDAVEMLLDGQVKMTPSTVVGGLIQEVKVTVKGPLTEAKAPSFNRAFNRLMWGLQRRRPGDIGSTYTTEITQRTLNGTARNDDPWIFEFT
jgi:hypothetical protein